MIGNMEIIKQKNGEELLIQLVGELNSVTASSLEESLKGEYNGLKSLVFDFAKLDYLSSAGLRVLLVAHKMMKNGQMVIKNVNTQIMEIFTITGFSNVLTIEN